MPETTAPPIWTRFESEERLCVNLTLRCNITCAHCNVESSPHRRERLEIGRVLELLELGWNAGRRHVTFSGGEVFLHADDLLAAVGRAAALGYEVDVETNAFWARSAEVAEERLRPFAATGLRGLCLSVDSYHARFFPVTRSINAVRAARALGLLTELNYCPSPWAEEDEAVLAALEEAGEEYLFNPLLNRGRGRDVEAAARVPLGELPDCDSLTATVHATGHVFACCELEATNHALQRTPVYFGSVGDEPDPLAAGRERSALVSAFYDPDSPGYFRRLTAGHEAFAELADRRFGSICDFCVRALSDPRRVDALREAVETGTERP